VHTGFEWGNLSERDCLEDLDVDGRLIFTNGSSRSGMEKYEMD
jgi:hypothetical protein